MPVNLEGKTSKDLETIVANCERLNRTTDPIYTAASGILAVRRSGDFNMEKTIGTIREYGSQGRFLSYKDVADASGLAWSTSFRRVGPHLDSVCVYTNAKGWPLLTAIIVHHDRVETGEMSPENRKGFLDAARLAGRTIDIDDIAFVKREQHRVFEWCQKDMK